MGFPGGIPHDDVIQRLKILLLDPDYFLHSLYNKANNILIPEGRSLSLTPSGPLALQELNFRTFLQELNLLNY